MKEVLRTTNPVELSWSQAMLKDAGIACFVYDTHMSIMEGSLGILPRRLAVIDEDFERAMEILSVKPFDDDADGHGGDDGDEDGGDDGNP